jgi:secondary thiamine-phosphate synthase enzyme
VRTSDGPEFYDLTEDVARYVRASGVRYGVALIFARHTTAAIRIQENEPLLLEDLRDLLQRVAPRDRDYRHDDFSIRTVNMNPGERANGHAHCAHLLLGASECVPIVDGQLRLGRWQSIFLVELDGGREREVVVQILGERAIPPTERRPRRRRP